MDQAEDVHEVVFEGGKATGWVVRAGGANVRQENLLHFVRRPGRGSGAIPVEGNCRCCPATARRQRDSQIG